MLTGFPNSTVADVIVATRQLRDGTGRGRGQEEL